MISGLERFVRELRDEGLAVSPGEWLDALRALEHLGVSDRETFRRALQCTVVKRVRQREVFDRIFDRFFAAPIGSRAGRKRRGAGGGAGQGERRTDGGRRATADRERRREDSSVSSRSEHGFPARFRRDGNGDEKHGRLRRVLLDPSRDASRREGPRTGPAGADRRDLRVRMRPEEERELADGVARWVERIRLGAARRFRRANTGPLYLRRVFRDNLSTDGVPFVLPRRRPRARHARVTLMIDVSWSAARASGLFLSLAGEFLRRRSRTRIFVFVDRAVEATAPLERWAASRRGGSTAAGDGGGPGSGIVHGGVSFAELVGSLPGLSLTAPSDYGRAFHDLSSRGRGRTGRDSLLVILGDGRTNRFDPQDWVLEEIAERVGSVLWLVPERLDTWGSGDSALESYLRHVDVAVEVRDLAGLARGVRELVRRL